MKTLCVMIEGGCWKTFDNYNMPFLQSMTKRRILYSRFPITLPATATILTGCDPHEHGFIGPKDAKGELLNTDNLKRPYVWDTLNVPYGVVNIPGTYPLIVSPYAQFMMAGYDSPPLEKGEDNYYPDGLNTNRYIVDLLHIRGQINKNDHYLTRKKKDEIAGLCENIAEIRTEYVIKWQESYEPDFLMVGFAEFDRVMHFCYGIEEIEQSFCELLDLCLLKIYEKFKPDEFLIFSDHGFCSVKNEGEGVYYLNRMRNRIGTDILGIHTHRAMLACKGDRIEKSDVWLDENEIVYEKVVFDMIKEIYT